MSLETEIAVISKGYTLGQRWRKTLSLESAGLGSGGLLLVGNRHHQHRMVREMQQLVRGGTD
jgi:hypothetical protein